MGGTGSLRIRLLPLPAESPLVTDSKREAAECADGQHQTDEVGEAAPHLQQREWDGRDTRFEPRKDGSHMIARTRVERGPAR